jgi:hypothetical protein
VQIEPGLRSRSPKNGNISNIGRRLSAVPGQKWLIPERGDRLPIRKSPPLAGISAITKDGLPESRTAWLTTEDSNSDIPSLQTPFEISREFCPFSSKSRAGDFRNYLSRIQERRRLISAAWFGMNQRRPRSPHTGSLASARSMRLCCAMSGFGGGCSCRVTLADCGAGASIGMVLPMIGMVRTGCSRWWATGGSSAFAAAPTGALFLAGDCTTKAVPRQRRRWPRHRRQKGAAVGCSMVLAPASSLGGQPASRISVSKASSLFVSGTCHIGSDGLAF